MWYRDVQSQVEVDELWIKSELFTKIEGAICSNHIVVEIQFSQRPLLVGQVSDAVCQHLGTFILDLVVIQEEACQPQLPFLECQSNFLCSFISDFIILEIQALECSRHLEAIAELVNCLIIEIT